MGKQQWERMVGGNPASKRAGSDFCPTPDDVTMALLDFLYKQRGSKRGSPLMDVMWCAWMLPFRGSTTYQPLKRPETGVDDLERW